MSARSESPGRHDSTELVEVAPALKDELAVTAISTPIPMTARPHRNDATDDVVDRLSHPAPPPSEPAGPFVTLFQCLISFGLLPLLLWPMRWAEFLDAERHDLLDLSAWWRSRVDATDAAKLDKITRRFRPRPILMVLPWLAVGFNVVFMAKLITNGDSFSQLWELTIGHTVQPTKIFYYGGQQISARGSWETTYPDRSGFPELNWVPDNSKFESHLYGAWITTLCLAYFCQWYAVRSHAMAVHSLVKWTNKLARDNRLARIKDDSKKIGLSLFWIVLAVGLCSHDAWWSIPMVFAGAFQRRYSMQSSPALRVALAGQARDGLVMVPGVGNRFCVVGHCGARLPAPARFCPRCGTGV